MANVLAICRVRLPWWQTIIKTFSFWPLNQTLNNFFIFFICIVINIDSISDIL